MTAPIGRPEEWKVLGDHEKRVRDLEAICCGSSGTGFEDAVAIRDRACSWYGLGDGSIVDGSAVRNYGSGSDGELEVGEPVDCFYGDGPGTVGIGVQSVWPLAQDEAAYNGCTKNYCSPGGYSATPQIQIDDVVASSIDWSVNCWINFHEFAMFCNFVGFDIYGSSGIWGQRAQGGGGTYLYVEGGTVPENDDPPDNTLKFVAGTTELVLKGQLVRDLYYMVTITHETQGSGPSIIRGYVDGALINSINVTAGIVSGSHIGAIDFGGLLASNWGTWSGWIDEWGLWCDEALSAADVMTLYLAGTPPPPVTDSDIDSGDALCGEPLVADGNGGATWGNSCNLDAPFVMPAVGMVTVQDVVDALVAMGLVTQGT